jgi:hypothetical protein
VVTGGILPLEAAKYKARCHRHGGDPEQDNSQNHETKTGHPEAGRDQDKAKVRPVSVWRA